MLYPPKPVDCQYLTVVYYVADPLGSILKQLCADFWWPDQPKPHITLLPPRPLRIPLDAALSQVCPVLQAFRSFEAELLAVRQFVKTNMLYLAIGKGSELLIELHDLLNTGDLAFEEEFEFLPHLTLTGPVFGREMKKLRKEVELKWNSVTCSRKLVIDEAVFLCLNPGDPSGWHPVAAENMDEIRTALLR